MQVTVYDDVRAFADRTRDYLIAREAEHNLLFGITSTLLAGSSFGEERPYLAVVEDRGQVAGVAMRTPPFHVVLSLMSESAVLAFVSDLVQRAPDLSGVLAPSPVAAAFVAGWQATTGHGARRTIAERVYKLERVQPVSGVAGAGRMATVDDRKLILDWTLAFQAEAKSGPDSSPERIARGIDQRLTGPDSGYLVWEDNGPVSLAGYVGPTPHGIRIGPVYTPPELRGRGYASACVADLSQRLLDSGRQFCFLFTNLANATANKIYQQIGYEPVIDVDLYAIDR